MGYRKEILVPHFLQAPPRMIKLRMGILSHGRIGSLQTGHREEGHTIETCRGIL
jgi:hypothetical protein